MLHAASGNGFDPHGTFNSLQGHLIFWKHASEKKMAVLSSDLLRLDDMPNLNDGRRVLRLAMMVDEMRKICKAYIRDDLKHLRKCLSAEEFCALGGRAVKGRDYSMLRQLSSAKREATALSQRRSFPTSIAVKKAHATYVFYETDDEDVEVLDQKGPIKDLDAVRVYRIALVLKRCRSFFDQQGAALTSQAARTAFHKIHLSKDEFVQCGGYRTVSSKATFSFYRQVVRAKRDMRFILERGHFAKGRQGAADDTMSSDEGSDADDSLRVLAGGEANGDGYLATIADGMDYDDDNADNDALYGDDEGAAAAEDSVDPGEDANERCAKGESAVLSANL